MAHSTLPALPRSITPRWITSSGPKTLSQVLAAAARHNQLLAADSHTQKEIQCLEAATAESPAKRGLAFIRERLKRAQQIKQEWETDRG